MKIGIQGKVLRSFWVQGPPLAVPNLPWSQFFPFLNKDYASNHLKHCSEQQDGDGQSPLRGIIQMEG